MWHYRDFGLRYHPLDHSAKSSPDHPPFHVYIDHAIPKGKTPTLIVSVQDYHIYFFVLTPLDTGLLAQLQVQLKRKHIRPLVFLLSRSGDLAWQIPDIPYGIRQNSVTIRREGEARSGLVRPVFD